MRDEVSFAAALEDCCQRVGEDENLDSCLNDHPAAYRDELARLVPLTLRLHSLSHQPSPEFRIRLEQTLARAAAHERPVRPRFLSRVWPFFTGTPLVRTAVMTMIVILIVVGSGVGVVQASDGSLPDSPLYHVKSAREWVELNLARDGSSRFAVEMHHFNARVDEMERAIRADKPWVQVALALRVAVVSKQAVDLALEMKARGNPQPAARVLAFVQAEQRQLDTLVDQARPNVRPALLRLRSFLDQQEARLTASI